MKGNLLMSLRPMHPTMLVIAFLIGLILTSTPPLFAQNTTIDSFNDAKKRMAQVFAGHEITLYCGCAYTTNQQNISAVLIHDSRLLSQA
jgi:hypothetical protein